MNDKVVLSHSPYLSRARSRMDTDTVVVRRSIERDSRADFRHPDGMNGGKSELEVKLRAVCDSLEAKTLQCKFLMQENEQLNNRLIELSKGSGQHDSLSVSSKMGQSCTAIDAGKQSNQTIRHVCSVETQTEMFQEDKENKAQMEAEIKLKEEICRLTVRQSALENEHRRTQAELEEKTKVAQKLNHSLLQAIQSSSTLMKERGQLVRKLEHTSIRLQEIDALYTNAKRYIFKSMDISQSEADSNINESRSSLGELSRIQCEKSKELEIVRYQLTLKTKQCEDKDLYILNLQQLEVEAARLKQALQIQQKQLEQLQKRDTKETKNIPVQPSTRLGRLNRTINNELQQIVHQLQLCERLNTVEPKPPQQFLTTVVEFSGRMACELEQLMPVLIARKLEVDRFMRDIHQRLSQAVKL